VRSIEERKFWRTILAGAAVVSMLGGCASERQREEQPAANPAQQQAFDAAVDAYIYGYPLVTMEMTRRVMTNVAVPEGAPAPMGQFANARRYPTAAFRDITAPNADTLYSTAWIDVAKEPYVLSLPDEHGRYYLFPIYSAWTDVIAVPGTRTTGTKAQKYAITGPGWKSTPLPAGVQEIKSPTNLVWLIGRTYCTGAPEDYAAVHAIQDLYSLVPLSSYGRAYSPPPGEVDPSIDMQTAVRAQVNHMSGEQFFQIMAALLKENPPAAADAPMLAKLRTIGIVPGQEFDIKRVDPIVAQALELAPRAGWEEIVGHAQDAGRVSNGWRIGTKTGDYGTDYLQRALVTAIGLGANRPQDAVYPFTRTDSEGNKLSGAYRYVVRFPKGQTPPVKGFWSLTMYDGLFFFVANPLNRYTLSPRNPLKYNADGSLDLYIQANDPGGDKQSNWLPAPDGDFILMLRLYWNPDTSPTVLNGSWNPPPVVRVK